MYTFYFEKLEVWQQAQEFAKDIYTNTRSFPDDERYGLTSQIRRASSSIGSNIAEGFSRKTEKDKARFINIAYSSGWEVLTHLHLAKNLRYLDNDTYIFLRSKLEEITRQLNALHKTLSQ